MWEIMVVFAVAACIEPIMPRPPANAVCEGSAVTAVAASSPFVTPVAVAANVADHPIVVVPIIVDIPDATPSAVTSINNVSATITTAIVMTHPLIPICTRRVIPLSSRRPCSLLIPRSWGIPRGIGSEPWVQLVGVASGVIVSGTQTTDETGDCANGRGSFDDDLAAAAGRTTSY